MQLGTTGSTTTTNEDENENAERWSALHRFQLDITVNTFNITVLTVLTYHRTKSIFVYNEQTAGVETVHGCTAQ